MTRRINLLHPVSRGASEIMVFQIESKRPENPDRRPYAGHCCVAVMSGAFTGHLYLTAGQLRALATAASAAADEIEAAT